MIEGIKLARNNDLTNFDNPIINKQLIKVASVPNIISRGPTVDIKFASKQPRVKPIVYVGLKNTSRFNASENLNCEKL